MQRLPIALSGSGLEVPRLFKKTVFIEQQIIRSLLRNADHIVITRNRRKLDYEQQRIFLRTIAAHKGEDRPRIIIRIDPLETIPRIIQIIERRILPVQVQKITEIVLQIMVQRLIALPPVQLLLLIPFMRLTKVLAMNSSFLPS